MTPDQELVLIFGALHLLALAFGAILFVMFLRSETTQAWSPPEDDDAGGGGGGNDRLGDIRPRGGPSGGVPLPDADTARVRLRGHEKLSDARPARDRRPAREPAPERVPARD